ncbi:1,3-beta-galactosyl-N-acetylhexosamine phosphorylase [Enterococcus sp. LJL128]
MTNKGRVTIPSEGNYLEETKRLMKLWGADAIRDSDGTKLDEGLKQLKAKIYTTYFVARGHNEFIQEHLEEVQQLYLLSERVTATDATVTIPFLNGFFEEQIKPNYDDDPKHFWEVRDRTTGEVVPAADWHYEAAANQVIVQNITAFHEYTVSFLAYMIWDPTQMYNHITNDWGDKPHDIPFDVRKDFSKGYMAEFLKNWLAENPDTDVVRFTTFFYHFTLFFNQLGKEKFVDWFGYGGTVSVAALQEFEKAKGYALTPEDFVDEGYYNSTFRTPSQAYLDYIDFIQKFVAEEAKALVDLTHESGKEAMMFLGDNWIGTEPYGKYFKDIGIDAVVGSVGNGTTLRLISEIPHVKYTEGRFLPYFFPDVFKEGNDPTAEARENWLTARRAILRKPVDRIGYGGYLSLANQFPDFVEYIAEVADEFRDLYEKIKDVAPYTGLKIGIVNAWGKLRSWQTHMVAHALWYQQIYSYNGILEALSGQKVAVEFFTFDEIKAGIPEDIDVLINAGDGYTAYSGGAAWEDPELIQTIFSWVNQGGGFIGVGEPSAFQKNGRYFQLASLLGVEKEQGFSLSTDKYFHEEQPEHFITKHCQSFDFGEGQKNIFSLHTETEILNIQEGSVQLAANQFGRGRSVYISGLPYSPENSDLLLRALFYAAGQEDRLNEWYSENPNVEVHAYPGIQKYVVVNNHNQAETALVYLIGGKHEVFELKPGEIIWRDYDG